MTQFEIIPLLSRNNLRPVFPALVWAMEKRSRINRSIINPTRQSDLHRQVSDSCKFGPGRALAKGQTDRLRSGNWDDDLLSCGSESGPENDIFGSDSAFQKRATLEDEKTIVEDDCCSGEEDDKGKEKEVFNTDLPIAYLDQANPVSDTDSLAEIEACKNVDAAASPSPAIPPGVAKAADRIIAALSLVSLRSKIRQDRDQGERRKHETARKIADWISPSRVRSKIGDARVRKKFYGAIFEACVTKYGARKYSVELRLHLICREITRRLKENPDELAKFKKLLEEVACTKVRYTISLEPKVVDREWVVGIFKTLILGEVTNRAANPYLDFDQIKKTRFETVSKKWPQLKNIPEGMYKKYIRAGAAKTLLDETERDISDSKLAAIEEADVVECLRQHRRRMRKYARECIAQMPKTPVRQQVKKSLTPGRPVALRLNRNRQNEVRKRFRNSI